MYTAFISVILDINSLLSSDGPSTVKICTFVAQIKIHS